jgi:hypothetical protein
MTDELPKQELLIKLMGMTTADNDGEALNALRKANALLRNAGWDWRKLIEGKITVVEDPFKTIDTPKTDRHGRMPSAPPRPQTPQDFNYDDGFVVSGTTRQPKAPPRHSAQGWTAAGASGPTASTPPPPKRTIPRGLTHTLAFGKHYGRTIAEVLKLDPSWLQWAVTNINGFVLDHNASTALLNVWSTHTANVKTHTGSVKQRTAPGIGDL